MHRVHLRFSLAFFVTMIAALGACTDHEPDGGGGGRGGGSGGGGGAAGLLDCEGVLVCAAGCAAADDVCNAACVDRATEEALAELGALVDCAADSGCAEDDDACIEVNCADELAACGDTGGGTGGGVGGGGGGGDDFPAAIVGTMRDLTTGDGSTYNVDSNSTVRFVRDDAAGEAAGHSSATHAFYRIDHIEYRIVVSGALLNCGHSADQSVVMDDPDVFQNYIRIARTPDGDGLHEYILITLLSELFPGGLTLTCDPGGIFAEELDAAHNMANGTTTPRTDLTTFDGTGSLSTGAATRTWTWELQAE